jgi:hypothetical protein
MDKPSTYSYAVESHAPETVSDVLDKIDIAPSATIAVAGRRVSPETVEVTVTIR